MFCNYYVLKLLHLETITFRDAMLSNINVALCYVLSQYRRYHFQADLIWFDSTFKLELNFLFFGRKFLPCSMVFGTTELSTNKMTANGRGGGEGAEPNHMTARKPGPLYIIQSSLDSALSQFSIYLHTEVNCCHQQCQLYGFCFICHLSIFIHLFHPHYE